MRYIYIDSENFVEDWIEVLDFCKDDHIFVLYTDNSKPVKIKSLAKVFNKYDNLEFLEVVVGSNALDFQLSSLIGYYIAKDVEEHIILSNDKGYLPLINFWKDKTNVHVFGSIDETRDYLEHGVIFDRKNIISGNVVNKIDIKEELKPKVQSFIDKLKIADYSLMKEKLIGEFGEYGEHIYEQINNIHG